MKNDEKIKLENNDVKDSVEIEGIEKVDKTHNILKVIIGILAFVVVLGSCFGAGYLGSKLGNNKDNNKEETESEEQNKEDKEDNENQDKQEDSDEVIDSEEEINDDTDEEFYEEDDDGFATLDLSNVNVDITVIRELFNTFREDNGRPIYWGENGENAKKYITYDKLSESDFIEIKCGNLEDSFIDFFYCAMNDESSQYYGSNEKKYEEAIKNETTTAFTIAAFEKKYKEIFGQNATFTYDDFSISEGPIAHYDQKNKVFAIYYCQCGGESGGSTQKITRVTQNGTNLILHTIFINAWREESKIDYTFYLEKETGNYIFVSRESK